VDVRPVYIHVSNNYVRLHNLLYVAYMICIIVHVCERVSML